MNEISQNYDLDLAALPVSLEGKRIAIVHDQLYTIGGAEKVLKTICDLFPDADVFALFSTLNDQERQHLMGDRMPKTTFLQKAPLVKKLRKLYFAMMPLAIEQLDLSKYDVVLSSSYLVAKGILSHPTQTHICYMHSPMRYAWDHQTSYIQSMRSFFGLRRFFARLLLHYMRGWDVRSNNGIDVLIVNSRFIAKRVSKAYRRQSFVLHPPVDLSEFTVKEDVQREPDLFVTMSRITEGKRIDLLVDAFRQLPQCRLEIIGDGPLLNHVARNAPKNVTFYGRLETTQAVEKIRKASGFVYAAEEDFGIAPVEAQACGTPVIALGRGGTLETVVASESPDDIAPTGTFFKEQSPTEIAQAVKRFQDLRGKFSSAACRENAEQFASPLFVKRLIEMIDISVKGVDFSTAGLPNMERQPEWQVSQSTSKQIAYHS